MRNSRTLTALLGVVVGLTAAGCATSDSGTNADGSRTLHVVMWKGGGNEEANVAELNRRFEAANPGTKVDFTYVKRGDYDAYNNTRLNGGTAADVLMVDPGLTKQWGRAGLLADLSGEAWVGGIDSQVRPFTGVDGKTYQFIQEVAPVGLYANLDLLRSVGVSQVPTDWPGFLAALERLKGAGKKGLLAGNKGGWSGASILQLASVGTVLAERPTWPQDFNEKKVRFNPDWAEPLSRLRELLQKGLVDGKTMMGIDPWGDGLAQFKSGAWGFVVQGAWELADFTKNTKAELAFVPFPANASGQPVGYQFVGTGLAVNAKSKVPDAARAYVGFWAQPANLGRYLQAEAGLSPLASAESFVPAQAEAFASARKDGRVRVAPPQYWEPPTGDDPFVTIGQKLFLDPGSDQAKLLDLLDASFGATRR